MDKLKELKHQIAIIDAIIDNLPTPYDNKTKSGVMLFREEQKVLSLELNRGKAL